LRDAAATRRVLAQVRPDRVFHLAAQSYVPTSWLIPGETLTGNVTCQVNLFEAARELELPARFHIAGSSEEYGLVRTEELPIREDHPLRPLSPYAVSKVAQDLLAYQYWQSYRLHTVRTRGFNHTGPRRGEVFVTSNLARQIAEVEKGRREPVVWIGNLDAIRDFTDVRDMVRAYWLALEHGEPGEVYNLCSGRGYTIRNVLEILLGLAQARVEVREDPARLRPSDVPVLVGDGTRFRQISGWQPTMPFEVTLKDLLDYWRQRV
ncbi:MAG: GDP-mannose 4,6-dehydratase, partial [Candidatus Rokubacteria bacterium]|nr:GDP-mannose 4,6-dehydratase [Candidatus Rokubacteria bacterium]